MTNNLVPVNSRRRSEDRQLSGFCMFQASGRGRSVCCPIRSVFVFNNGESHCPSTRKVHSKDSYSQSVFSIMKLSEVDRIPYDRIVSTLDTTLSNFRMWISVMDFSGSVSPS